MTQNLRLLISQSHDAHFNLAVEECIFLQMNPRQHVLFLWRNADVVVIGRAQNPWKECNTRKMHDDGIMLARRNSGGGAVYQDLGNTCFTFMAGKPEYNKDISTNIVLTALHSLNIPASASGRNDIVVTKKDGDRKISGSAYRESPDRGFHHGTLLLNVDLTKLTNYLNPDPKKLQAKGITSVRSRVTNITDLYPDLTHEKIFEALIEAFFAYYGKRVEPEYISPENMPNLPGFKEQFEKQKSWDWNFGAVLAFSHQLNERFVWGGIDLHLNVNKGIITEAKIYSDSLVLEPLESFEKALLNTQYSPQAVNKLFPPLLEQYPDFKEPLTEIQTWIIKELK